MPTKKTVDNWGFSCTGYELDEDGEVVLLWCKLCREFYKENQISSNSRKGVAELGSETYIRGTSVIKKNNFKDHVTKSLTHNTAVRRLNEPRLEAGNSTASSPSSNLLSGLPRQATIYTHMQKLSNRHRTQLTRKFQLADFVVSKGKSFKLYSDMANFNKATFGVDLGESYLNHTDCSEIIHFISKSILQKQITVPINEGSVNYYSIMNDGSSSAKTMDEKELFLLKTAESGIPTFSVLSLEEVKEANAEGLKAALENSLKKAQLDVNRTEKELGMCTDGAAVNVKMHRLIKEEIGDHYQLILCPAHKIELAMHDAFKNLEINTECERDYVNVYYFFKRANLKWRLFKRQAIFMEISLLKYQRPHGTRWVEHQVGALKAILNNLPIFIGFANHQIASPHNQQMKDTKAKLEGLLKENVKMEKIIFNTLKVDILSILEPISKVLQESSLILPRLVTVCEAGIKTIEKLLHLLRKEGKDAFMRIDLFPHCCSFLKNISEETRILFPDRMTRSETTKNPTNTPKFKYHGYLLRGCPEKSLNSCVHVFTEVLENLIDSLKFRLSPITENPLYISISHLLDTKSYKHYEIDEIYSHFDLIVDTFQPLLIANGCQVGKLKQEFEILFSFVKNFAEVKSPLKAWPLLFSKKHELGISNILHLAEIGLALPLSNADSERVFSFLWRVFTKERTRLSNKNLENILRLRCENGFDKSKYDLAIELFLTEYPNGEIRKGERRIGGHNYPSKRKLIVGKKKKSIRDVLDNIVLSDSDDESGSDITESFDVDDILLDKISDDSWSDS